MLKVESERRGLGAGRSMRPFWRLALPAQQGQLETRDVSAPFTSSPSYVEVPPPSMKRWTTAEELAWLTEKIPKWHNRRNGNVVGDWLTTTTNQFITAFPSRKSIERSLMHSVSEFSP